MEWKWNVAQRSSKTLYFHSLLVHLCMQVSLLTIGRTMKERNKSVEEIISEISIIREQLRHPNIVRYHQTQTEGTRTRYDMIQYDTLARCEYEYEYCPL